MSNTCHSNESVGELLARLDSRFSEEVEPDGNNNAKKANVNSPVPDMTPQSKRARMPSDDELPDRIARYIEEHGHTPRTNVNSPIPDIEVQRKRTMIPSEDELPDRIAQYIEANGHTPRTTFNSPVPKPKYEDKKSNTPSRKKPLHPTAKIMESVGDKKNKTSTNTSTSNAKSKIKKSKIPKPRKANKLTRPRKFIRTQPVIQTISSASHSTQELDKKLSELAVDEFVKSRVQQMLARASPNKDAIRPPLPVRQRSSKQPTREDIPWKEIHEFEGAIDQLLDETHPNPCVEDAIDPIQEALNKGKREEAKTEKARTECNEKYGAEWEENSDQKFETLAEALERSKATVKRNMAARYAEMQREQDEANAADICQDDIDELAADMLGKYQKKHGVKDSRKNVIKSKRQRKERVSGGRVEFTPVLPAVVESEESDTSTIKPQRGLKFKKTFEKLHDTFKRHNGSSLSVDDSGSGGSTPTLPTPNIIVDGPGSSGAFIHKIDNVPSIRKAWQESTNRFDNMLDNTQGSDDQPRISYEKRPKLPIRKSSLPGNDGSEESTNLYLEYGTKTDQSDAKKAPEAETLSFVDQTQDTPKACPTRPQQPKDLTLPSPLPQTPVSLTSGEWRPPITNKPAFKMNQTLDPETAQMEKSPLVDADQASRERIQRTRERIQRREISRNFPRPQTPPKVTLPPGNWILPSPIAPDEIHPAFRQNTSQAPNPEPNPPSPKPDPDAWNYDYDSSIDLDPETIALAEKHGLKMVPRTWDDEHGDDTQETDKEYKNRVVADWQRQLVEMAQKEFGERARMIMESEWEDYEGMAPKGEGGEAEDSGNEADSEDDFEDLEEAEEGKKVEEVEETEELGEVDLALRALVRKTSL